MDTVSPSAVPGAVKAAYDLGKDLLSYATHLGKKETQKLAVDWDVGFNRFLDRNLKQYSKIKTLLNPTRPMSLESTFVSPFVVVNDKTFDENELIALIEANRYFVITGMGGSGKSVFLRHLFIRYYNEGRGKIPFLVELRNVPKDMKLRDYLHSQIRSISKNFDDDLFEYALRSGKFVFLFDGFDEVDAPYREAVAKEITGLTYAYDENFYVVSGRPDDIFASWTEFHVAEMAGLTQKQAVSLLKKLPYDRKAKNSLIHQITKGGLYSTHGPYLANPLLCTIMLLTFDQVAEVPNKMHLFFAQTFDVLFYRHDATKGTAFKRKFLTGLPIDEFRLALSSFSAFSYLDYGPTMTRDDAVISAQKAITLRKLSCTVDDLLSDFCLSVSIMLKEGSHYSYIHRSFQEYFCAVFLSHRNMDRWDQLIERLLNDKPNDSVVNMLSDMNSDRFDVEFLLPRISDLANEFRENPVELRPKYIFELFFYDLSFRDGRVSTWTTSINRESKPYYYLIQHLNWNVVSNPSDTKYDWTRHLEETCSFRVDDGEMRPKYLSDGLFLGTPLMMYLQKLRDNVFRIEEELKEKASSQKRLLSAAFFA